jgi:putative ABC transport system permease protein
VLSLVLALSLVAPQQSIDSLPPSPARRSIALDERLSADAGLRIGDRVVLSTVPGGAGDTVVIAALARRGRDPAEVAIGAYRVYLHLDQLQHLIGYGERVDRFAVATRGPGSDEPAVVDSVLRAVNAAAFGFRAYPSREIAVETSKTFLVVSRFHRAIGVITIVASAVFLLCIMLLKVDERRRDVAAMRLMGISARSIVRGVVLESALVAISGSALGIAIGAVASALINWHYQQVYRTPLTFSFITGGIMLFAVTLSLVLGLVAGWLAARRLVGHPPLTLFGR